MREEIPSLLEKKGHLLLAALGVWLLFAPLTFGYESLSDLLCGGIWLVLGVLILKMPKRRFLLLGGYACVGLFLQLAPLLFWAKESAFYLNDTLTGMIGLFLSFFLARKEEEVEEAPPGWSFNPSAWFPRGITVFLALLCWCLARYLASYQLGYIDTIKDPFFGEGSIRVISSSVAQFFPVSDAGLGAFGYSLEFLLGLLGGTRRWKTMPWLTICFGALVVPAGMISILLIILQPVLVKAWCGLCLIIALCMLAMVLLTLPELGAVIQLLHQKRKEKRFWETFWTGDSSIKTAEESIPPPQRTRTSMLGFTTPWNLVVLQGIAVWVILSSSLLNLDTAAADSNYIIGPLLFTVSTLAFSELLRSLRLWNSLLALALILAGLFLEGFTFYGRISNVVSGICICILMGPSGILREKYGKKP